MFIIHEHCRCTSAIDKYWLFPDESTAVEVFTEMVKKYKDSLDLAVYQELYAEHYETEEKKLNSVDDALEWILKDMDGKYPENTVYLTEDDYLVLARVDSKGFARRP